MLLARRCCLDLRQILDPQKGMWQGVLGRGECDALISHAYIVMVPTFPVQFSLRVLFADRGNLYDLVGLMQDLPTGACGVRTSS